MPDLAAIARALVADGKGILAADESFPTIQKRFAANNIASTEETRRNYRELLLSTGGIEAFISGVILFEETLHQRTSAGILFPDLLTRKGVIPGIKVDKGTIALPGRPGEKITQGLDGLRQRLDEYAAVGARFTKWRAVITIGDGLPSRASIKDNALHLSLFAAWSQQAGMVPVVEPEVLMDGEHGIDRCEEVTSRTLTAVFAALREHGVMLEGMLLKPNMVLPGKKSLNQASPSEIADATIRTLLRTVPAAVPGIVFLSGGQSPEQATTNLNLINTRGPHPWQMSFSFGRALQESALRTWGGSAGNRTAAQHAFLHRARLAGASRYGTYSLQMERLAA